LKWFELSFLEFQGKKSGTFTLAGKEIKGVEEKSKRTFFDKLLFRYGTVDDSRGNVRFVKQKEIGGPDANAPLQPMLPVEGLRNKDNKLALHLEKFDEGFRKPHPEKKMGVYASSLPVKGRKWGEENVI